MRTLYYPAGEYTIPFEGSSESWVTTSPRSSDGITIMARTVFVVDDSEIVLSVSRQILEGAGYRVVTQNRAARCLSQIQLERPTMVLLDVNMPDLPGSAMSDLCSRARAAGAMVVLYSSLDVKSLRRLVSVSGADHFIQKTDNAALLTRQVARLLGEHGEPSSKRRVEVDAPGQRASGTHRRSPAVERYNVLLVDRDMAALSRMREIVQQMGYECEFALSPKQAIEKLGSSIPSVIVASDSMPQAGLLRLFEAAVTIDHSWSARFVITASEGASPLRPPGFSGPIVRKPLVATSLEAAIEQVLQSATEAVSASNTTRVGHI